MTTTANHQEVAAADPPQLAARVRRCLQPGRRFILGIAGPPGTGKSTLVPAIARALAPHTVAVAPMDGFHLANTIIDGTTLERRKGAADTFDAAGYAHLISRLRAQDEDVVYAPAYDRAIGDPIAASIAIPRETEIVITEGNYLLLPEAPWITARAAMDQVWFLETPEDVRVGRLIDRHIEFGKNPEDALTWAKVSDETNVRQIVHTRRHADLILRGT